MRVEIFARDGKRDIGQKQGQTAKTRMVAGASDVKLAIRSPFCCISILCLMLVYLTTSLTPLAPSAQSFQVASKGVIRECAGDCDICGCSPERRASHTCCCWLKIKKAQLEKSGAHECCKKNKTHKMPILICNSPCGRSQSHTLVENEMTEHLPYNFRGNAVPLEEDKLFSFLKCLMANRPGEPPDPPPKIFIPV